MGAEAQGWVKGCFGCVVGDKAQGVLDHSSVCLTCLCQYAAAAATTANGDAPKQDSTVRMLDVQLMCSTLSLPSQPTPTTHPPTSTHAHNLYGTYCSATPLAPQRASCCLPSGPSRAKPHAAGAPLLPLLQPRATPPSRLPRSPMAGPTAPSQHQRPRRRPARWTGPSGSGRRS